MVCPSCGRQVAGTEACRFCGANVKNGVTLSPESVPLAGGGTSPGTVDDSFRQKHDATTSLILGIVSFATLPVVFAFSYVFANLPVIFVYFKADLPADVFAVLFATAIFGGMLALVLGRRANQAVRRIEGEYLATIGPSAAWFWEPWEPEFGPLSSFLASCPIHGWKVASRP